MVRIPRLEADIRARVLVIPFITWNKKSFPPRIVMGLESGDTPAELGTVVGIESIPSTRAAVLTSPEGLKPKLYVGA